VSGMDRLRQIMARLRGPEGCPWDREQTLESLGTFVIEEAYEVLEAIATGAPGPLKEELGDLLFQIVFQARVSEENGDFDLEDVMEAIGEKIVRRHPHVFASGRLETSDQVLAQWERIKQEERRGAAEASILSGVPGALPALLKALRISTKAGRVGFDWDRKEDLLAKVDEEVSELRNALRAGDRAGIEEELGDLLFTIANVARQAGLDPEAALQAANRKFASRFLHVERRLKEEGRALGPESRQRMEELWREAKEKTRRTSPGRNAPSGGTSGTSSRRARRPAAS
jgi:nucleoside triphosphate diphosphatase